MPLTKWIVICALGIGLFSFQQAVSQEPTQAAGVGPKSVGPETEKRFPPLVVPDGFKATLFACDPLIEYPSVIALGPRPGTLFLAHDYVTGLGIEIVRRDEVRLIEDSDNDGYADRSTVFAGEFNSIQGLAFYDGNVFVMHAPLLTRLRDTDGDGVADERKDLIKGLGLPPEENSNRLHCANGVTAGHDGWLYLSLGDRGCDVKRPEGDRLLFQQGGILRCHADGSDLHVFSTGLRNIYDVALDAELNVFVRDNENDGGDYMIRVNHCFFGSDHGYPYHYYERPDEPMQPLADLGRGSSAGGTSYLETTFPKEFQQSLFFCEWGRAVVRYRQTPKSSSFETMTEIDFAAGAPNDPYGFKPTDLVIDYDGSLLISDWCDGQRPKRGRGRIYRISHTANLPIKTTICISEDLPAILLKLLDSPSYHARVAAQLELQRQGAPAIRAAEAAWKSKQLGVFARMHVIWLLALSDQKSAVDTLLAIADFESDPQVKRLAIRAIGDLVDPILVENQIKAERGDEEMAERIAKLGEDADPRVLLEVLTVLRRLRWCQTPEWIAEHLDAEDPALDHAAQQALRNADDWIGVNKLLDQSPRLRRLALQSLAEQRVAYLADRLIDRLQNESDSQHRIEAADSLSRIVRKLPEWTYWGFRPALRTPATVDWEKTPAIVAALNESLADADFSVRAVSLRQMQREGVSVEFERLAKWLGQETDAMRASGIFTALASHDAGSVRPLLEQAIKNERLAETSRIDALSDFVKRLPESEAAKISQLASSLPDSPVLAAVLAELGRRPQLKVEPLLLAKTVSPEAAVRAAAIRSLGQRKSEKAGGLVRPLLGDSSLAVRLAAAEAAGPLHAQDAAASLFALAGGKDKAIVAASLASLRELKFDLAVPPAVAALEHRETQISALRYLREFGGTGEIDAVAEAALTNHSIELQREATRTLIAWQDRKPADRERIQKTLGTIHGQIGQPLVWDVTRGETSEPATVIAENYAAEILLSGGKAGAEGSWVASTPLRMTQPGKVEFLCSATGQFTVKLDGKAIFSRAKAGGFRPDSDRFVVSLTPTARRLTVEVTSSDAKPRFHLRFRNVSSKAEHERLIRYALSSRGNAGRGRDSFMNKEKAGCIKCHRLGSEGGKIGPDLTGIGRRFSRIHLVESILEPSRTVAPSYVTLAVVLENGQIQTGIKVSETNLMLVLGDNQGKIHEIAKSQIETTAKQAASTMPEGLEKKLTDQEFLDLIAFLESQKSPPLKPTGH